MKWNVPGKCGPHCELFFFLILKELAIAPTRETSTLASASPASLLMSVRSVRSSPCTSWRRWVSSQRAGRRIENGAAQRLQGGKVKAKLGRRMKVRLPPNLVKAMRATMRCTSSGCMGRVTRSLFSCRIGSWQRWHQAVTWPWTCCAQKCMRPGSGCGCQMSPFVKEGRRKLMTSPSELSWLV